MEDTNTYTKSHLIANRDECYGGSKSCHERIDGNVLEKEKGVIRHDLSEKITFYFIFIYF